MILLVPGQGNERGFASTLLFATMLAERGHDVVIDEESLPADTDRSLKYEASPFLADLGEVAPDIVLIPGAHDISTATLARLRALDLPADVPVVGLGAFPDHQADVGARTKLAYALGRETALVDLPATLGEGPAVAGICPPAAPDRPDPAAPPRTPEVFVVLPSVWLDDPQVLPFLAALDNMADFRLSVVMPGVAKDRLRQTRYATLNVFGHRELPPGALARSADVMAFFGEDIPGERMLTLAIDMLARGKAVLDCTAGGAFLSGGAPVVRGPAALAALPNFLEFSVVPNLAAIGRAARDSAWIKGRGIARLEAAAGIPPPARPRDGKPAEGRVVFLPTNGVGLGHAQRCGLIARSLSRPDRALFMAFPSCLPLIEARGFPCLPLVQKSPDHPEEFANDIVNHVRLRRTLRAGDHLVFDGGHVFESIYRAINETGCTATWIRRGLWRPGQVAQAPIERERAFRQVLVPDEAFPELNVDYSRGAQVRHVGPVVQRLPPQTSRDATRARLSDTFGIPFDTLVVTMLGGGVASDRTAQVQAISGLLDARPGCLHLVVVWPNARVAAGLTSWRNTRLVRTRDSLALALAADLVVSAAGYNSFHELLYARIPAIFIPQEAVYLDDQERRARAASDRGLAETVLAHELLLLERRIGDILDRGRGEALRKALCDIALPEPGTLAAARLIEAEAGA